MPINATSFSEFGLFDVPILKNVPKAENPPPQLLKLKANQMYVITTRVKMKEPVWLVSISLKARSPSAIFFHLDNDYSPIIHDSNKEHKE